MQALISLLLIVFSLIGIADAGYISYEQANNIIPACGPGFDCGSVLTSPYSKLGPFPLSYYGLTYYITILALAVLYYLDFELQRFSIFHHRILRNVKIIDLLLIITSFGFAFSLYLMTLMAFIIKGWCLYCLISALVSLSLFITTQILHAKFTGHSSFLAKRLILELIHKKYVFLIKPIFFLFDAESIHNFMTKTGAFLGKFAFLRFLTRWFLLFRHTILHKRIDGITFPNPIGLSAGFDYNGDLTAILPEVGFGWHTVGTVTYQPYAGNPKPRLGRFPNSKALLVNKGLKSLGAQEIAKKIGAMEFKIPVGISIGSTNTYFSNTTEQIMDILRCFLVFEHSSVKHAYYELNISCPNTFGGEPFTTPQRLEILLSALDKLDIKKPVYVKMPIDQSEEETLQLLEVIAGHCPKGVIFGNLTKDKNNPAVLPADRAVWKNRKGNLSGKPTFERSNNLIALTKKHFKNRFTIIGTGGIFTVEDALVKVKKGADLLQLITGMVFEGPSTLGKINLGLADHLLNRRTK